ncbi:hypothetical protein TorRG33x02_209040 [Trema orientale]|uniref:Uncharacterized protein n=1 Tax=Trema orientale TaxID=63057 RepID=A0A2P5ECR0_TREOI|nr:hypothetical protein TorRG33x02_209040 [Trema orientale]
MKSVLGKTCFSVHQVVICWPDTREGLGC